MVTPQWVVTASALSWLSLTYSILLAGICSPVMGDITDTAAAGLGARWTTMAIIVICLPFVYFLAVGNFYPLTLNALH